MGSEARGEQTLATDQDNGIVFEDVPAACRDTVRGWCLALAERAVDGLERCGFPRCKGNVMASNPELCRPLEGWKAVFARLIAEPDPEALLKASIYFDLRLLHGEAALVEELWRWLLERIARDRGFLNYLAGALAHFRPPVTRPLWRLRTALGWKAAEVDLKRDALLPLVHGLRVMALEHGLADSNSLARLAALRQAGAIAPDVAQALGGSWEFLTLLRLRHQFAQAARGERPGNTLSFHTLDPLQRRFLLDAMKTVRDFQDEVLSAHGGFAPG
jgi:CBS domain-containing protein